MVATVWTSYSVIPYQLTSSKNVHNVVNKFLGARAKDQLIRRKVIEITELLVKSDDLFAQRQQP